MRRITSFVLLLTLLSYNSCTETVTGYHSFPEDKVNRCPILNNTVISRSRDLDCSHNNLSKIPIFSEPSRIHHLNLSYNLIERILPDSFKGFHHLVSLSLEGNKLLLNDNSYPPGSFDSLMALSSINLLRNIPYLDLKSGEYPKAICELKNLKHLQIDGLYQRKFDQCFLGLTMLKNLTMSGPGVHCNIGYISTDFFHNMPQLHHVDISYCKINSMDKGPFQNLKSLYYLDISGNEELTFRAVYNLTYGMDNTAITTLKMNRIHCLGGAGTVLKCCQMTNVFKTKLKNLFLAENRLEILEYGVIAHLPKTLIHITVARNRLTMGHYVLEYSKLNNLISLNGSLQLIPHDPVTILFSTCRERSDVPDCTSDSLLGCGSVTSPTTNDESKNLSIRKTRHNTTGNRYRNQGDLVAKELVNSHFSLPIPFPKNLKVIYYNSSRLYLKTVSAASVHNSSLEEIYVQDNFFYNLVGPFEGLDNLKILDVTNVFCSHISTKLFLKESAIRILRIGNNMLGNSLAEDTKGEIFQKMVKLENIDLSKNRIYSLPCPLLQYSENVRIINVSNNYLSQFIVKIDHMRNLTYVDLSNNKINTFSERLRTVLERAFQTNGAVVDLSANPLSCSCSNYEHLKWMAKHHTSFVDIGKYKCSDTLTEKVVFNFSNIHESIEDMERFCSSYVLLIISCVILIAVFVTLLIAKFIHKQRWKLRYALYMAKMRYRGTYLAFNNHTFDFDAFVSYADSDRDFVVNKMIPALENQRNLRLLVHDRDFLPGNDISDNIMAAIRESKKTICILSKNFFKSYWCNFEFNMACMEMFNARKDENVIFLIALEKIRNKYLHPKMLQLIEDKSYIRFPKDLDDHHVFWDTIFKAITD